MWLKTEGTYSCKGGRIIADHFISTNTCSYWAPSPIDSGRQFRSVLLESARIPAGLEYLLAQPTEQQPLVISFQISPSFASYTVWVA